MKLIYRAQSQAKKLNKNKKPNHFNQPNNQNEMIQKMI